MSDDKCSSAGNIMLAFILGGLVGAGLTALLSPLSGEEARQKITDFKDDVQDRAGDYRDQAKEKLNHAVEKGKGYIDEKKSVLSRAIEAGKEAYRETSEES